MDPAAAPSSAGRILRPSGHLSHLRRVLLVAVAGAAWLTLSGTAAQADDTCTFYGQADDAGSRAAAAGCADADDLPIPALDGVVSLDIAPAPAHTWSAGAVPGPGAVPADVVPATADKPADDPDDDSGAGAAVAPPPAAEPADTNPADIDPAAPEPTAPALPVTPPVTVPVDPGVPGADPVVPDPGVPGADPVVPDPVVPDPGTVPPVVDPTAPIPDVDPPVVDPAAPVTDPTPLPGDPAGALPGGGVPGDVTAGTPAGVDGASPSTGTPTAGTAKANTAKAGTAKAGTAKPDSAKAGTAKAPEPPASAPVGPGAAVPLAAYRVPVAYSAWLVPERPTAVAAGAAPPVEPPAGTGEPQAPSGNPGPSPWHGGTGLPVPDALPPAPGSGSGSGHSANGPTGTAAWMPSLFFCLPTIGADPIGGPLQHEYSAVCADPGSSPD